MLKEMPKNRVDSPSLEDSNGEENSRGGGHLKKGPWTSAEDQLLVDYVNKHGEGNWNAVQRYSGLSRCGKSCRLRWANHLRPDLKKGAFTIEEERHIIELHAKMGNKWARMASELPGRTDNEIKNFWNTRIKRRQRAGLPIYPPEMSLQNVMENEQSQDTSRFPNGDPGHSYIMNASDFEIPDVKFKNLDFSKRLYQYSPLLLEGPERGELTQSIDPSQGYCFTNPSIHYQKRLRESEPSFPGFNGSMFSIQSPLGPYDNDEDPEKIVHPPFGSPPYDSDIGTYDPEPVGLVPGSHSLLNGNSSSSEPNYAAMKLELPSLQYLETQFSSWDAPPSPLPSFESTDTLIHSPSTENVESERSSPQNNGLLESVVYESKMLNSSKNDLNQKTLDASVAPGSVDDYSTLNIFLEYEGYIDPSSPLGHSAASVFSEYTPISGMTSEEPQSLESLLGGESSLFQRNPLNENSDDHDFLRPDALLDSDWFEKGSEREKEKLMLKDALAALRGEDPNGYSK